MGFKMPPSEKVRHLTAGIMLFTIFTLTPAVAISERLLPGKDSEDAPAVEVDAGTSPSFAGGGLFAGIYLGAALPQDEDQHIRASGFGVVAESTDRNVNFDASITSGVRVGYWSKRRLWLGVAMDVSYFQMDSHRKDISVYPVSALLMFRLPNRRFQPYMGIGPALFINKMAFSIDLSGLSSGMTGNFNDTSYDVGLDTRAGFAIDFYRNTGLFAEYRFTHYSDKFTDRIANVKVDVDTNSNTHHIIIGISYRF